MGLTGTPWPPVSLTGAFGEAEAGGFFDRAKMAGLTELSLKAMANPGISGSKMQAEIDAPDLGKDTGEAQNSFGGTETPIRVAQYPAGEASATPAS
jgi:hypothetical protein